MPLAAISVGKLNVEVEPVNKSVLGGRLPVKLTGNPQIAVHIPLQTDQGHAAGVARQARFRLVCGDTREPGGDDT